MSNNPNDFTLGRTLSWLLRHAAAKEGLTISPEGYIPIDELLEHKNLCGRYTIDDIKRVVDNNNKKRFDLRTNNNKLEIKANQGHSLKVDNLDLEPILTATLIPNCVHGTYFEVLPNIKKFGLSRMNRNHIHFATDLPTKVVSGARRNAEVFVYINVEKALSSGLKFFKSSNGVILSPGNPHGYIEPIFFLRICDNVGKDVSY